jgi:uncharacterized protein (TIGR01777 family)
MFKQEVTMRIIIAGGSGHLGTLLATALHARGDEVVVVSRKPAAAPWRTVGWDVMRYVVDGADVVINLAGRSVDCRYGEANRTAILHSRVDTAREVRDAIGAAARPPRLWLQASTATIYAHRYDAPNDEATGTIGGNEPDAPETWRFSIDVAKAWEEVVDDADLPSTRKVKLRTAIVMSHWRGGAFSKLRFFTRLGLGSMGDGRQFVSWIHERDFIRAVEWLIDGWQIDHDEIDGAVNLAAPNPLPNADFLRAIRDACGARFAIRAPAWLLEIAAFFLRTETELLLKSRRVVPTGLLNAGFTFDFPTWPEAAAELCHDGKREW